jgi:hypothetical protein
VIHYSQLAWSKRALPLGTVAVAALTRIFCSGTLWVHDPDRIGVVRSRHRAGSFFKGIGLRLAIRIVGTGITSVHPSRVFWVTDRIRPRIAFCPTASNVGGADNAPPADRFTISLFDKYVVSDPSKAGAISEFVVALRERVGPLRIRVLGSGPPEAAAALARTLRELDVDADVPGHVTAEELRSRLAASHAFVVLRGPLSSRSGTVAAAIACGLPVVGFDGTETGPPLDAAGVIAVPIGDRAAIIDHLVRLEQRPDLRVALSKRSADVAEHTLNWRVTAELVERLLVNRSSGRTRDDRVGFDETFHD